MTSPKTLLAATLALAGAVATTTAAVADPSPDGRRAGEDERIRAKGGTVWFFHHGEIVKVKDTRRDGLGVRAYLLESGTFTVEDRGAGGKPEYMDRSIPEGQKVKLKLCYFDDLGNQRSCSQLQAAIA